MVTIRKDPLVNNEVYHVFSRSIADFKIFNTIFDFSRMKSTMKYYKIEKPGIKFSRYLKLKQESKDAAISSYETGKKRIVKIIAYCLMPTHVHFVLKQKTPMGITKFMSNILNSYSKYFNIKYKRKGPLWEERFRNVHVISDEQLLHLTRYVHLNPVTAYLADKPETWEASSCKEYLDTDMEDAGRICSFNDILSIEPKSYKKFLTERISYQKELAKIKSIFLE